MGWASLPVRIYDLNAQQLITLWLDELSGLSDLEWKLFEDVFPPDPEKRGKGMPHVPYRQEVIFDNWGKIGVNYHGY